MPPQQLGRTSSNNSRGPGSGEGGSSVSKKVIGHEMRISSPLSQVGGGECPPQFGERVLSLGFKHSRCTPLLMYPEDPYYLPLSCQSFPATPLSLQAQNQGPRGRSRHLGDDFLRESHPLSPSDGTSPLLALL